jgi:hypothetical protein
VDSPDCKRRFAKVGPALEDFGLVASVAILFYPEHNAPYKLQIVFCPAAFHDFKLFEGYLAVGLPAPVSAREGRGNAQGMAQMPEDFLRQLCQLRPCDLCAKKRLCEGFCGVDS